MQKIQENIAQKLKSTMQHQQKTIADFADELGISQTALKNYMRGECNPRADTITLLAEKLGLTPAELISDTQKEADQPRHTPE